MRDLPPGSIRDPRWWHRAWAPVGRHRPEVPLWFGSDQPPLWQCRCGWVGISLGEYARFLGAPVDDEHPLAGEWIWLPWRVWNEALREVW